eukprot:3185665-Alexandrium_andersonii.AAC.1
MLGTGHWALSARHEMPGTRHRALGTRHWAQAPATGHCGKGCGGQGGRGIEPQQPWPEKGPRRSQ